MKEDYFSFLKARTNAYPPVFAWAVLRTVSTAKVNLKLPDAGFFPSQKKILQYFELYLKD